MCWCGQFQCHCLLQVVLFCWQKLQWHFCHNHFERELQLPEYFCIRRIVNKLGVEFEDVVRLGKNHYSYAEVKSASPDETSSVKGVVAGMIVLGHATARNWVNWFQRDPSVVELYDVSVLLDEVTSTTTTTTISCTTSGTTMANIDLWGWIITSHKASSISAKRLG